jgi:hypothetical protein
MGRMPYSMAHPNFRHRLPFFLRLAVSGTPFPVLAMVCLGYAVFAPSLATGYRVRIALWCVCRLCTLFSVCCCLLFSANSFAVCCISFAVCYCVRMTLWCMRRPCRLFSVCCKAAVCCCLLSHSWCLLSFVCHPRGLLTILRSLLACMLACNHDKQNMPSRTSLSVHTTNTSHERRREHIYQNVPDKFGAVWTCH